MVAVNSPDDDDTSYIDNNSATGRQSYTLAASAIPPGSTVNSVTVRLRARKVLGGGACYLRSLLLLGGTIVEGASHTMATSYANHDDTIARPGGGAWSIADLAALEIGVRSFHTVQEMATTLYAAIDYTPPAPSGTGNFLLLFP